LARANFHPTAASPHRFSPSLCAVVARLLVMGGAREEELGVSVMRTKMRAKRARERKTFLNEFIVLRFAFRHGVDFIFIFACGLI
jgi:hypothetical protein